MDEAKKEAIRQFLRDFKEIAGGGRNLYITERKTNMESLAKLGLRIKDCKEEILGLSLDNYCAGPKRDKERAGEIWEFGKMIDEKEVYIKLKIAEVEGEKITKCISFHVAQYPLCFPLKENPEETEG